jgi:NAD(P)-dependent dehydrogenase (short-subunit alcohol dehydrogenase family)
VAEIEAAGGTAAACYLDVTDEATYESLFSFAEACYGGVDHVFLNAGAGGKMIGPGDMQGHEDTSDFDWSLDVNVIGAVMGMKHGIKALRKRGGGSIITMSNNGGGGSRGANGGALGDITLVTPMALISAAMDQLARVGAYYKNENIRVYGLKPGLYESPMVDEWVEIARNQMDPNMTKDALAGFNMFFKTCIGDPVHIARVVETLVNNTTKYPPGSNIVMDNDATFCSSHIYKTADTETVWPEITVETLRGYDGGEYTPQEDRLAAYIESLDAAEA